MLSKALPKGYQKIAAATLATATALTPPAGANFAFISVTDANVRYRDDGVDPTATDGFPLTPGDVLEYDAALASPKFILESGSPILHVQYYFQD
jgi:hypothetical protein